MAGEPKMATCSICGQGFTARGLPGHMRFVHKKTKDGATLDLDTTSLVKLHRELGQLLGLVRETKEQLAAEEGGFFSGDSEATKALRKLQKGYERREREINHEVAALVDGKPEEKKESLDDVFEE